MTTDTIDEIGPRDFAVQLFRLRVLPALPMLDALDDPGKAMFYGAFLASLFGTMAAEFGHERAVWVVRTMLDEFAAMGDDLQGSATQ